MKIRIKPDNDKTIFQILREKNVYMPAPCAGRGVCGKCRVRVLSGYAAVTDSDKNVFSQNELQEGFRLSCKCVPMEELLVEVEGSREESMDVLGMSESVNEASVEAGSLTENEVILGIDIGTTTIAMALADAVTGRIIDEYLTINRQRMYGADVISRIQASVEGKGNELRSCIREDLWKGIAELCHRNDVIPGQVIIAANTTMIHLLMGYPCNTLGVAPFTPYNIDEINGSVQDILGVSEHDIEELYKAPVRILPGISTFVGADIVADMLVCDMAADNKKVSMLIDLGTNGEMAIGNGDRILVTSAAAGPAFEGGNITHGTGSVPGAVCGVEISGEDIRLKTIRDEAPTGICGTGTIEIIYELLKTGLLDETGYMEDEEFVLAEKPDGNVSFFQKDVRELQLAKSAIRAGVETLLLRYGVKAEDVDNVYLAGGFGYHINLAKAVGIGLFPKAFEDKIKIIGNGSLIGALACGRQETKAACNVIIDRIKNVSDEVGLAMDNDFNELYMKYMFFDGEF